MITAQQLKKIYTFATTANIEKYLRYINEIKRLYFSFSNEFTIKTMFNIMTITDKMLHFSISFLITATIFLYCHLLAIQVLLSFVIAAVVAIFVGVIKEIIDAKFDIKDFIADISGIAVSIVCIIILMYVI